MRDLSELIAVADPAWPRLPELVAGPPLDVRLLAGNPAWCAATLPRLQA